MQSKEEAGEGEAGEEELEKEESEEKGPEGEEFHDVTMADMEVPKKDTTLAKIEKKKELVTPAARLVELKLQVQNLEQLLATT